MSLLPNTVVALFMLVAACGPLSRSAPPPLEPEDFMPAGVPADADSTEIRASFGAPDSMVVAKNPYDAFSPVLSWYYRDFIVKYEGSAVPASFVLTGAGESTLRGVRVGDHEDHVLQKYGAPTYRQPPVWSYIDEVDDAALNVLEFLFESGTVARIHLGRGIAP